MLFIGEDGFHSKTIAYSVWHISTNEIKYYYADYDIKR